MVGEGMGFVSCERRKARWRGGKADINDKGKSTPPTYLDDIGGMDKEPPRDATGHGNGKVDRSREQHHLCSSGARSMDMWWGGGGGGGGGRRLRWA